MLQFGEHGVVVGAAVGVPEVGTTTRDLRIQSQARGRGNGVRALVEKDVARQASLISQRRHILVTQIVLHIKRIVMGTHGGKGAGEDLDADRTSCWQSIRAKARNRV